MNELKDDFKKFMTPYERERYDPLPPLHIFDTHIDISLDIDFQVRKDYDEWINEYIRMDKYMWLIILATYISMYEDIRKHPEEVEWYDIPNLLMDKAIIYTDAVIKLDRETGLHSCDVTLALDDVDDERMVQYLPYEGVVNLAEVVYRSDDMLILDISSVDYIHAGRPEGCEIIQNYAEVFKEAARRTIRAFNRNSFQNDNGTPLAKLAIRMVIPNIDEQQLECYTSEISTLFGR